MINILINLLKKILKKKKILNKNIIKNYKNTEDNELIKYLENNNLIISSCNILDIMNINNSIIQLSNLVENLPTTHILLRNFLLNSWFRNNLNNLEDKYFFNKIIEIILKKKIKGYTFLKVNYNKKKIKKELVDKLLYIKNNKDIFDLNIVSTFFTAVPYEVPISTISHDEKK